MRAKKSNEQKRAKSPENDERATRPKETEQMERAATKEKPVVRERAVVDEKTGRSERAGGAEKTMGEERAGPVEGTTRIERAGRTEKPAERERAGLAEKTTREERAGPIEGTTRIERAGVKEKPVVWERAVVAEKTGSGERAGGAEKTTQCERAGPTEETGEEKRAVQREETEARERRAPIPAAGPGTPRGAAPSPSSWALVRRLADSYDDVQRLRIAVGNRLVKLGRNEQVADSHASVLVALSEDLARHEESMAAAMRAEVQGHIMGDWLVAHRGIAEQSAATVIATLERRPHWSGCRAPKVKDRCDTPPDGFDPWDGAGQPFCRHSTWIDPKHPSSFWKFCGLYPGARRERGKTSEFNAYARVRMYRIATNMIRSGNEEYGAVYRQAKQKYLQYPMIHGKGPDDSGHALYADLMARRAMIKQFLVDLHVEWTKRLGLPPSEPYSARIHRGETPQTPPGFAAGVSA